MNLETQLGRKKDTTRLQAHWVVQLRNASRMCQVVRAVLWVLHRHVWLAWIPLHLHPGTKTRE
jgi:hypothetical protein